LGWDPASEEYRLAEEQCATRLEQLTEPLERDPTGRADWIDAAGNTYNGVGPVPREHFDAASFNGAIARHLRHDGLDFVVVDLSGLTGAQRREVMNFINLLPRHDFARVLVPPY
jgi:hypothetical protein